MVSNTVDDCLPSQIAQKIFKSKIEARPVNAGHHKYGVKGYSQKCGRKRVKLLQITCGRWDTVKILAKTWKFWRVDAKHLGSGPIPGGTKMIPNSDIKHHYFP